MTTTRETTTAIEAVREGRGGGRTNESRVRRRGTETPQRARYLRSCTEMHGTARAGSLTRERSERAAHFLRDSSFLRDHSTLQRGMLHTAA